MSRALRLSIVQAVTSSRILLVAAFVTIGLTPGYEFAALLTYTSALSTDIIDGTLARRLESATRFGVVYDGFADKTVTIASAIYCSAIGTPLLPCMLVILRDLIVILARSFDENERRPSRAIGATIGAPIRAMTLWALLTHQASVTSIYYLMLCWFMAMSSSINAAIEVLRRWAQIRRALTS